MSGQPVALAQGDVVGAVAEAYHLDWELRARVCDK